MQRAAGSASRRHGSRREARIAHPDGPPAVFIVYDDDEARRALERALGSDYVIRSFSSVSAFFAAHDPEIHGCIIIETPVPEADGLDVLARLIEAGCVQPVIFLSASATISTTVRALRAGAINFLTQPVNEDVLLGAVRDALKLEAIRRESSNRHRAAAARFAALTQRERQVLSRLVGGKLNKQIAADLGIVENTVKAHRARIMQKLAVRCLAELVLLESTTHEDDSAHLRRE